MHLTTIFLAPIFLFFTTTKAAPFASPSPDGSPNTDSQAVVDVEFVPFVDSGDSFDVIVVATFLLNGPQQITNQFLIPSLFKSARVTGRNGKYNGERCDFFSDPNGETITGTGVDNFGLVFDSENVGANIMSVSCSSSAGKE